MAKTQLQSKALIVVFEHVDKYKTGLETQINNSIEIDATATKDDKVLDTVKTLTKLKDCVILTTPDVMADKKILVNALIKHCKLKKITVKWIKKSDF